MAAATLTRREYEDLVARVKALEGGEFDPMAMSEDIAQHSHRLAAIEQELIGEQSLSPEEACLVAMYRYLIGRKDDKERVLRVDGDGNMEMGYA